MNQLRSEDSNQRQRVGMFMALPTIGQVFLQVIEGRKGAGASEAGEAVTPDSGAIAHRETSIASRI